MDPIIGAIIGAVIAGIFSLCGVIITNNTNNVKMEGKYETYQAVTNNKIDTLMGEVRELAGYTKQVPILQTEIERLKKDVEVLHSDVERLKNESHK